MFSMNYQWGSVVGKRTKVTAAGTALERLKHARIPASDAHREATGQLEYMDGQIEHLTGLAARFARRRNHLLAAAEAQPQDAGSAADLASTAERLQADVEQVKAGVIEARAAAAERQQSTSEMLAKIDAAADRLSEAMLEQANTAKLRELKRGYRDRLRTVGAHLPGHAPAVLPPIPASVTWELEGRVRDATRLTYEAEALTALQREPVQ